MVQTYMFVTGYMIYKEKVLLDYVKIKSFYNQQLISKVIATSLTNNTIFEWNYLVRITQ